MSGNETFFDEALVQFLLVNYWANESDINLTKEDYEHILAYLHTGRIFDDSFLHASKEIKTYCLKYSLFGEEDSKIVKELIESGNSEIDSILEKLSDKNNLGLGCMTVYRYLLSMYINNFERQMQILSFKDYELMILCMNIIFPIEFPEVTEDSYWHNKREQDYEKLFAAVPTKMRKSVKSLLQQNDFDKLLDLLHTEENINNKPTNLEEELIFSFPWEDKVIEFIESNSNTTKFFADIIDEYSCETSFEIVQKALSLF